MNLLETFAIGAVGSFAGVSLPALVAQRVMSRKMRRNMVKLRAAKLERRPGTGAMASTIKKR